MKIHRLSEDTIKVILTKDDFIRRNIDVQKLRPGSQTYRQLVLEVMAQASGELNFDASDCRLVVEGSMNLKNELTLLISKSPVAEHPSHPSIPSANDIMDKLPTPEEFSKFLEETLRNDLAGASDGIPLDTEKHADCFPTDLIICFRDFDKLISFLHTVPTAKAMASKLYMYNDDYYLAFKVYEKNVQLAIIVRNCASEFDGEQIPSETILSTLLEHGTLVIKRGAVPFLLRKFSE